MTKQPPQLQPAPYVTLTLLLPRQRLAYFTVPLDLNREDVEYILAYLDLLREALAGHPAPRVVPAPDGELPAEVLAAAEEP